MDVSLVIINFNTFKLTCACIDSILKHTSGLNFEIILVDNASAGSDCEKFKELFPAVNLIMSKRNLGFSKGNNLGIASAKGKYILLLNSDTLLKENSIKITFDYLENHSKAAVVSARLIFMNGWHQSCCQRFPSILYMMFEILRLQKFISKDKTGKILLGFYFNYNENTKADWVWGTYFMFRSNLLELLPNKKLNEDFFMYHEDMQWCMDFKRLGYEIHYCADTEIIHLMGGSLGDKNIMMKRNYNLFLQKNYNFIHRGIIQFLNRLLSI